MWGFSRDTVVNVLVPGGLAFPSDDPCREEVYASPREAEIVTEHAENEYNDMTRASTD